MNWRRLCVVISLLVPAVVASADTIHVDCNGGGDYETINEAVYVADEGDTVLVAPGAYTGPGNCGIDFYGVNMVLMSSAGPESTVIDVAGVGGVGILFWTDEDTTSVVNGFTIMHADDAVRIQSASPVIDNCIIRHPVNGADKVGIRCLSSGAVIRRTQFLWITGDRTYHRIGLECDGAPGPTVGHCIFNTYGRGIHTGGGASTVVRHCQFLECCDTGYAGAYCGGGSPVFEDCLFYACTKDTPFGSRCTVLGLGRCPRATLRRVVFDRNSWYGSTWQYLVDAIGGSGPTALILEQVVFWKNEVSLGSGHLVRSTVDTLIVSGCTFADNESAGLAISTSGVGVIEETIFAYNGGTAVQGDLITTTHSCVFGNAGGDSLAGSHYENLFTWPLFCDHEDGDLTLRDDSPCLPANNPWGVQIGAYGAGDCGTGIDAHPFPVNGVRLRRVHPNPAMGFESTVCLVGAPGYAVDVAIYDLSGRRVRTLTATLSERGRAECAWDLRDDLGRRLASGVYFVEVTSTESTGDRAKLVVVR